MGIALLVSFVLWELESRSRLNYVDIFLVCDEGSGRKSFQIWVNNKDAGFSLAQHQSLPPGVQAITFSDIGK